MVGIIPARVWEPSRSDPIVGALIQHHADSPISVMVRYIVVFLAVYIPTQGNGRWKMRLWRMGVEEQRVILAKKGRR